MDIKSSIIDYVETNGISKEKIASALEIDIKKLDKSSRKKWSAQDLLEICQYLNIEPEDFYCRN